MHESTMTRELVSKIITIATQNEAKKVTGVRLVVGPLAGLSEGHLREHFEHDTQGTIVEGADLQISMGNGRMSRLSAEVLLESIEIC